MLKNKAIRQLYKKGSFQVSIQVYAWFVSSQLTTRLSDHLHEWIDIIFIFSVKAWPRSEFSTKTHEYNEEFGEN